MSAHSIKNNIQSETFQAKAFSSVKETGDRIILSIDECRNILNDYESPDNVIEERLQYLTAMCRNVIRHELKTGKKYEQSKKN